MRNKKIKKHARAGGGAGAAGKFPCLRVMKLADLTPAGYNPRTISAEALAQLTRQIEELDNLQPLTFNVQTKTLIGGHQRVKVYLARGDKTTPVWCVDLPAEKEKAANLALNNLAGEWDERALENILRELQGTDFDLGLTGFDAKELAGLAAGAVGEGMIKTVKPQAPPSRTWFLVGFPTVKMPALQPLIDQIAELPDAYLKSTVNDDSPKKQNKEAKA